MAKQDYIFRYLTIIKKLRRSKEATFEEIRDHLQKESEFQDRPFAFSNRTFLRDINEIRSLFKIDIQYNFSTKVYYIADDQQSDMSNRMLESLDTINSLRVVSDVSKYMFFEKRQAIGTEHFHGLLHAIKNRIVLKLTYQKYQDDESSVRLLEPYALKESKGRWYLFARDLNDKKLKTFGLDRVLEFENTSKRFDYPVNLDVNEIFRYCFGVINLEDYKPEDLIISLTPDQGKYINSYPLHESQSVIENNDEELRIKLKICITHDLIMELLSLGESVEVIEPEWLRGDLADRLRKTLKLYKK